MKAIASFTLDIGCGHSPGMADAKQPRLPTDPFPIVPPQYVHSFDSAASSSEDLREDLLKEDGPLKKEGHLPEKRIREGLESLLELGFLATPPEKPLHLEFSIPILGESLRAEFRKLWNDLLHQIEEIASADARPSVHLPGQRREPASLRAEVEIYLREETLNAEHERREFFVASAGVLLQRQFPDPDNPAHEHPLHQRLG